MEQLIHSTLPEWANILASEAQRLPRLQAAFVLPRLILRTLFLAFPATLPFALPRAGDRLLGY